ncbi:MAG: transketolase C-terminal domain-containing protein [Candidatus Scatosoma sp.]
MGTKREREYSQVLGDELQKLAAKNDKIVAVTAAMTDALGLRGFFGAFPERAFDVGICEENAAVLCAALATGGMKPYYAIYSTFLQRAFDEIIHDVCAQDLPVTFCIDRAGISGADGETHQGVFDLSYLTLIPGLTVVAPKDTEEFRRFLKWSEKFPHPLAIRYPRCGKVVFSRRLSRKNCGLSCKITLGSWEYLYRFKNAKITVIAAGERCLTVALKCLRALEEKGISAMVNVVNGRFIKPLDVALLADLRGAVITVEDNVLSGGFGSEVERELLTQERLNNALPHRTFRAFAYKDCFIPQGSVASLQKEYGVSCEEIQAYIESVLCYA